MLRKKIRFLLENNRLAVFISLCLVVGISVFIRIQNVKALDGKHFLGFDPYYFFRIAETITLEGVPPERDMMAYVPLGVKTDYQAVLTPYFIFFLYRSLHFFFPSITLYHAAIFYPVLCFAVSLLVFYFLIQRTFDRNTALLATVTLGVIPTILFRTMAGFADRDAFVLLLSLIVLYFYVRSAQAKQNGAKMAWMAGAGLFTMLLALAWEGAALFIALIVACEWGKLLFGEYDKNELAAYLIWYLLAILSFNLLSQKYQQLDSVFFPYFILGLFLPTAFLLAAGGSLLVGRLNSIRSVVTFHGKLPLGLPLSMAVCLIAGILGLTLFADKIRALFVNPFGYPAIMESTSELRRPSFANWWGWFGIFLFLFIGGAALIFQRFLTSVSFDRWLGQASFFILLGGTIYSRFFPSAGKLLAEVVYFLSVVLFLCFMLVMLLQRRKAHPEGNPHFVLDRDALLICVWFLFTFSCLRVGERFLLLFTPPAVALGCYCFIWGISRLLSPAPLDRLVICLAFGALVWSTLAVLKAPITLPSYLRFSIAIAAVLALCAWGLKGLQLSLGKNRLAKMAGWVMTMVVALWLIAGFPNLGGFARMSYATAKETKPIISEPIYSALEWVKHNTSEDAVVAAWWDYGYWIQGVAERATIVDNNTLHLPHWIHLIARHLFCAQSEREALEFLFAHRATHLLFTTRDLALLPIISRTGSDATLDRACEWNAEKPSPTAKRTFLVSLMSSKEQSDHFKLLYPKENKIETPKEKKKVEVGCCGSGSDGLEVGLWEISYPEGISIKSEYLATRH